MAHHLGTECGHPVSKPGVATCRTCWRNRGADLPPEQHKRKSNRASVCGHLAPAPGARFCRSCYDKPETRQDAAAMQAGAIDLEDGLRRALKGHGKSLDDLSRLFTQTPGAILDQLLALKSRGLNLHQIGDRWSMEREPERGSATNIAPYVSRPNGTYRFGWHGDTHLCSKYERLDVLRDIYRRFADADLDRIFHTGNWIDGEARFNKYDIHTAGMDAQIRYLVEQHPVAPNGLKIYTIAGDDHEGWYSQREGVNIGKYAESEMRAAGRTDWIDLGYMEAFIPLQHAVTGKTQYLHSVHPGGGSSYATSYTVQKLVESYSGGSKPAVLLAGHYHKLEFINVRNVWCIQTGCSQDQTPFARKKRLHYALGGGICELEQDAETGAIVGCSVQMFHYFDKGYYSGRWSLSGDVNLTEQRYGGEVKIDRHHVNARP
jgi:hypothetical protein